MLPSRSGILAEAMCTSIRPEFRVPTDLFLLFAHEQSTKIYGPLSFFFFFCARWFELKFGSSLIYLFHLHRTIRQNYMIFFHLFFRCARPFDQKLESSLIYFFYLYTTNIRLKLGRGRLLFNSFFPYCQYFVCHILSSTTLIFLAVYSWKCCSCILYVIFMAIWSPRPGAILSSSKRKRLFFVVRW